MSAQTRAIEVVAELRRLTAPPVTARILEALRDWGGREGLSGRAVAGHAEVSPQTAIDHLHQLERVGAVSRVRCGKTDLWHLTEPARRFVDTGGAE